MQQSARFDRLVRGETTPLPEELPALAAHFAALPQQIMPAAVMLLPRRLSSTATTRTPR